MEVTCIIHTDNTKSMRYSHDPVEIWNGIATYHYKDIPDKTVEEVQKCTTDQVQALLSKIF